MDSKVNSPSGYQVELSTRPDGTWTVTVYDSENTPRMRFIGLNNTDARLTYNDWLKRLRTNQDLLDIPTTG